MLSFVCYGEIKIVNTLSSWRDIKTVNWKAVFQLRVKIIQIHFNFEYGFAKSISLFTYALLICLSTKTLCTCRLSVTSHLEFPASY